MLSSLLKIFLTIIPITVPGTMLFINISTAYIGLLKSIKAKSGIISDIILFLIFDNVPINAKGIGINNNIKLN